MQNVQTCGTQLTAIRMSESKDKEKFIELPLCEIIQKWGSLPGGEQFVKDIQSSWSLRLRLHTLSEHYILLILMYPRSDWQETSSDIGLELEDLSCVQRNGNFQHLGCISLYYIKLASCGFHSNISCRKPLQLLSQVHRCNGRGAGLWLRSSSPATKPRDKRLQKSWRAGSGAWARLARVPWMGKRRKKKRRRKRRRMHSSVDSTSHSCSLKALP